MLKVIKPGGANTTERVVQIPDADFPVLPLANDGGQPVMPDYNAEKQEIIRRAEDEAVFIRSRAMRDAEDKAEKLRTEILAKANAERQSILEQANLEAEQIREQARMDGFEDGKRQMEADINRCLENIMQTGDELEERQKQFFKQYQQQVKDFALEIAQKILHKQISQDPEALTEMVQAAVSAVREAEWITVSVSNQVDRLAEVLRANVNASAVLGAKRLDIVEADLPEGACIVETPTGIIDASVSTQVENLKEVFKEL